MKTIIKHKAPYILIIIALFLAACKKDFLNVTPRDRLSDELVWKDEVLAEKFVSDIYNAFENNGFSEEMLASATDEALFTHPGRGYNELNTGVINGATQGWSGTSKWWERMYVYIRFCNITIERLTDDGKNEISSQEAKDKLLAQVYFIRGYCYHQLLRYYGGVPIITKSYLSTDDFNIARSSYEECVSLVIKDCDEASRLIAGKTLVKGRVNALAILALKARTLIYAASDLHDRAKLTAKVTDLPDLTDKLPLFCYMSGSQDDRYRLAQVAAKAVLDAGTGYKLNFAEPVSADQGKINYKSIAMGGGSKDSRVDQAAASDILFARYFISEYKSEHNRQNGPNGYHNWGGNTPTGLLADDYDMIDGSKFSWNNPAQKAAPYKNRDPRFYASILYDGADWKSREMASVNGDPANQIQTGSYDLLVNGSLTKFPGLDTRQSSIEPHNGAWTGYYCQKFIDSDPDVVDAQATQFVPWPFFRYTEAVLNYVEASIELGETATAKDWLNKIRFRAGMPAVTTTDQSQLREIYRHERRIEMAYEEQRFFDVRRWLIAPETIGRKVTIVKIDGTFKPGKSLTGIYKHDETIYNYTYTPQISTDIEDRVWKNQLYFLPLSRDEIRKNTLLVQNPGYVE